MGASSSTFENDIETSVSKLFGSNVCMETSRFTAISEDNMETSFSPECVRQTFNDVELGYPIHMTVNTAPDEYQSFDSLDHMHQCESPDDDGLECLNGGRLQLNKNDNYNAAEYMNNGSSDNCSDSCSDSCSCNSGFEENGAKRDPIENYYVLLHKVALKGDWGRARKMFKANPNAMTARITNNNDTALHVAAAAGHSTFVEKLVKLMPSKALELKNNDGETPLHVAATAGITKAAKAMVMKNPKLPQIWDDEKWVPLVTAVSYVSEEQKDMVEYLCDVTRHECPSPFAGSRGGALIWKTTASSLFDIALELIERYPKLATKRHNKAGYYALGVLARRPDAFQSGSNLTLWQRFFYSLITVEDPLESVRKIINNDRGPPQTKHFSLRNLTQGIPCIKQLYKKKLMHKQALALVRSICEKISQKSSSKISQFFEESDILTAATRNGTIELVTECIQVFPDIIWLKMKNRTILGDAIQNRREKVFNLICGMNVNKKKLASYKDDSNNTILHLAAKLAPTHRLNMVSGAALQMQRELQWFKEVENISLQKYKQLENNDSKTGRELFTENHKELKEKGEKWMKDTAQSCMLVATLITTVMFSAAMVVLGGKTSDSNSSTNDIPIFLHKTSFMVFAIADALALFSSITSGLTFFSILTSRYAEEDFLNSLPKKLIIGLATLFFSVTALIVAFSAALSFVLEHRLAGVLIPIVLIACLPLTLIALFQFPMFVEIVRSTYGPSIFGRRDQHIQWSY